VIICTVEDGSDVKERASAKAAVKATINLLFLYQSAVSKQMPCPAPPNPTAMPHIMGQRDVKEAGGGCNVDPIVVGKKGLSHRPRCRQFCRPKRINI